MEQEVCTMIKKLEPCRECGSFPELLVDREICTISLKCPKCGNGVQASIAGSWNAMQHLEVISNE